MIALQQADRLTADRTHAADCCNREAYKPLRDGIAYGSTARGSLKDGGLFSLTGRTHLPTTFFLAFARAFGSKVASIIGALTRYGFVIGFSLLLIEGGNDPNSCRSGSIRGHLRDYRDTIPRLFDFNGFTILSYVI